MKIGILTLPLHTNYGGILQAYALQTVLERMGHEVHLIEKKQKPLRLPLWKAPLSWGWRILKNLMGHPCPVFLEEKINHEQTVIRQYTKRFIKQYIKIAYYDDYNKIQESEYDAIIVGSDQVWRPQYFVYSGKELGDAYLKFACNWNIKRIAYAASFGTEHWEYTPEQTYECASLVKKFDAVSVREHSAVELCMKNFHINAHHLLDPTMLLNKEDYMELFKKNGEPSQGNLLVYILDPTQDKERLVRQIVRDKKLKPFNVNSNKKPSQGHCLDECIQPPVEQWLRGFYDAEFVITDSFHACVFSILFKKTFIVYGNEERGMARFNSLLQLFGLENRLIINSSQYQDSQIIWDEVDHRLHEQRVLALNFLESF